jgi:CBS domain-containing protein
MKLSIGSSKLVDELFSYVSSLLKDNSAFFGFLARVGITYKTQLSFFGKIQTESIEEHSKSVNVKNAIRVIVNLIRLYAMKNNLSENNTMKRLKKLYEMNVFSGQFYKDIVFSYEFLTILQLKTQVNAVLKQSNPANYIDLSNLSTIEVNLLKNVFSQVSIFQSKLKYDFNLSD